MARTIGALLTWASAAFTNTVRALLTVATLLSAFGWRHLHLPRYCSSGAAKEDTAAAAKEEAAPELVGSRAEPREPTRRSLSGKKTPVAYDALPASLGLGASLVLLLFKNEYERRLHELLQSRHEARIAGLERRLKEAQGALQELLHHEREACQWREIADRFTDSASVGKESDWGKLFGTCRGRRERIDDDKKRSSDAPRKMRSFSSSSTTTGGTSLDVGRQRAVSAAGDASKEHPAKQTGPKRPRFLVRRARPEDLSREVVLPARTPLVASRSSSGRPVSASQQRVDAKMAPPPPPSLDRKVVLYVTSLRGIRKTYEDCRSTKSILQGYGVRVDERDLWMHDGFKDELRATLGAPGSRLLLPQVFADGKHLGGAEEIRRKHLRGELSGALKTCEMAAPLMEDCGGCGGARFVPCDECSGSCKVFREEVGGFRRCPKCNANGLVRCPLCSL